MQTDFVMVYGLDETLAERVQAWKSKGMVVHLMTGISWGRYQDYLYGRYDGRDHTDEGQLRRDGVPFIHETPDVPYMVPTLSFTNYLIEKLKAAVDVGVEAIHMEEPEFWVDAGYSPAFRREWLLYFGESWTPPHLTPEAQFMASELKAHLFARCIGMVAEAVKDYSLTRQGTPVRFYVPTHSLLNYCQFRIVSPESRLMDSPAVDGYIAQVWTGTSRLPNVYRGVRKERTFETAYLEYGVMQELVRGTSRRMWFLHDPIEDDPTRDWSDYRSNYFKTLVASLLHSGVARYEVCPWPGRIYNRNLPTGNKNEVGPIPEDYAAILAQIYQTLGRLADETPQPWCYEDRPVGPSMGVFLSDTAHFQRLYPEEAVAQNDLGHAGPVNGEVILQDRESASQRPLPTEGLGSAEFSSFYGLALPLLKAGAAVLPVQLDNLRRCPDMLHDLEVLVLSYEFQKPVSPDLHAVLATWVRQGGVLIYVGDGSDVFHGIRGWWNTGRQNFANPGDHLRLALEIDELTFGEPRRVGTGVFAHLNCHPFSLSRSAVGAESLCSLVDRCLSEVKKVWSRTALLGLYRGPYLPVAYLDESTACHPVTLRGKFLNLLTASQALSSDMTLNPGDQAFLIDLDRVPPNPEPLILAAGVRLELQTGTSNRQRYRAWGQAEIPVRVSFRVDGPGWKASVEGSSGRFPCSVENFPHFSVLQVSWAGAEGPLTLEVWR